MVVDLSKSTWKCIMYYVYWKDNCELIVMESHLKNNLIQLFVRKVLTYLSQDHLQKNS